MHGGWRYENEHCSSSISTISTKASRISMIYDECPVRPRASRYGRREIRATARSAALGAEALGAAALPGLLGGAVRAGDRRRDGRAEAETALTDVCGFVERATRAANALDCWIAAAHAHGGYGHRRGRRAPRVFGAGAPALAQGVGDVRSHGSMRKDPSHCQRFRAARRISWAAGAARRAFGARRRRHGGQMGLEY